MKTKKKKYKLPDIFHCDFFPPITHITKCEQNMNGIYGKYFSGREKNAYNNRKAKRNAACLFYCMHFSTKFNMRKYARLARNQTEIEKCVYICIANQQCNNFRTPILQNILLQIYKTQFKY